MIGVGGCATSSSVCGCLTFCSTGSSLTGSPKRSPPIKTLRARFQRLSFPLAGSRGPDSAKAQPIRFATAAATSFGTPSTKSSRPRYGQDGAQSAWQGEVGLFWRGNAVWMCDVWMLWLAHGADSLCLTSGVFVLMNVEDIECVRRVRAIVPRRQRSSMETLECVGSLCANARPWVNQIDSAMWSFKQLRLCLRREATSAGALAVCLLGCWSP